MNAGHRFGTITSSLLTCFICTCLATHFRGGYFLWKPTATSSQIEISYRVSWRRSSAGHFCNDGHGQNKTVVGEGSLICISGCNGTITNLNYICTDFSETEDWTTGTRNVPYNIPPGVSRLVVRFSSCCWIDLLTGSSNAWSMTAMTDVTLRKATGKINHSPVTSVSPIVRIVQGCSASIDLSVSDNDGDTVRCRWSNRISYDECAGICNTFLDAFLNETTCTIHYTPLRTGIGFYGVAVQVEDFPATGGIVPYSSVPVQFLVQIYSSTRGCFGVPVFLQPTKLDGEVTYIKQGVSHKEKIIARSSVPNARIAEITTVSPLRSEKSQLMQYPNAENAWYVEIGWTPDYEDADQSHILCFSATDQHGLTSKQRCITLTVTQDIMTISPESGDDPADWFSSGDKTSINANCTLVSSSYKIPIFNSTHKDVYVCANGVVSFDLPFESPGITSTTLSVLRGRTLLAPYLVYINRSSLNRDASITYRVHNKKENASESADIYEAKHAIEKFHPEFYNFDSQFILIADWTNVTSSNISEKMTFRLVLFTNGADTFVLYIYSDISLRTGSVFIGYSAASGQFHKNYHSFEKTAYSISTTAITYGYQGLLLYRLTYPSAWTDINRQKCLNWYLSERNDRDIYHEGMSKMPLCPCSRGMLDLDQFFTNDRFTTFNGILCTYILPNWQFQPKDSGKMCCYDNNGFRSDGPFGFIRYHKDIRTNEHKVYDLDMKEECCKQQTNLCNLYYDVRPLGHCYTSFPSRPTVARGDPHITTLDGRSFTFNGWGEYTLMTVNTSATGIFDLQARTERTERKDGNLSDATIFTAFAAKDDIGISVHVELNRSKTGIIIYAKSSPHEINFQDYTKAFFDPTKEFSIVTSYLSLKRHGQTHSLSALFSSGISVIISTAVKMLSIEVAIPNTYKGRVQGLMGNFDGDDTNDFMHRNGTLLNASSSDRDIFRYGQTWMIDPIQSAFIYPPGKSYKDFTHAEFTPKFIDEVDPVRVQKAKLDCGNDTECIFDYVFTDSREVAIETKRIGTEAMVVAAQIGNEVPYLTGPLVVNIQLNQPFSYTVNGSDGNGDPITYYLTNPPGGVQIIKNDDGSATVTGTITDMNPKPLIILITDGLTYGSSNVIYSSVCSGCSNRGKCDFTHARNDSPSSGAVNIALCICDPYWNGQDCEKDLDGCATQPCSPLRTCVDNPVEVHKALKIGYNCSDCPKGYLTMIDGSCEDINECNTTPEVCTQRCINTVGSFRCDCDSGYRLDPSNKTVCMDINECGEGPRKCDQVCNNSPGNYSCGCFEGYSYNLSTGICKIVSGSIPPKCMTINCNATSGCRLDENRNATCFCNVGYELNTNGTSCDDFDECKANICQQKCINSHRSYSCSCFNGYVLDEDNKTCNRCEFPNYGENCKSVCTCDQGDKCNPVKGCVCSDGWTGTNCDEDVDECQKNILICGDPFKTCINTNGSYMCLCIDGFRLGSNGLCQDIQECEDPALNNCTQLCTNENGGFSCGCNNGYISDRNSNTLCQDIDECVQSTANCQHTCLNTNGSFTCTCYPEYDLMADGKSCKLADDHSGRHTNLNCSHIYNFQDGAVSCSCNNGYRLGADNQTCLDIDECADLTSNRCSEKDKCFNIEGGYTCSCSEGYTIGNDGRDCIACNRYHYGPNCSRECNCGVGAEQCDSIIGCVCKVGWTGQHCDVDKDECSYKTCVGQNTICINTFGSYKCTCKPGFNNETSVCEDTDECKDSRQNDCEQDCLNTIGSYVCRCGEGYLQNGTKCQDIDECSGKNDCSYRCENTIGGYRCICGVEFKLNITDQRTCIPETACQRNETAFCLAKNALCTTVKGQSECYCEKGYAFDNNNMNCQDIDECRRSPCDTYCVNKNGTFECGCMEGNKISRDGLTCIACPEGTYGPKCTLSCSCFPNNTVQCDKRSGNCTCNAGFTGIKCESDINECEIGNGGCSKNSKCINTNGSRECICEIGYIKTWGGNCIACDSMHYGEDCVSECACAKTTSHGCNNINGTCTCRDGWQGSNCTEDIDECQRPTDCTKPHTRCNNTHGSYVCMCEEGYRMTGHHQCEDVNECLEGTHNCTQACDNIPGSFKCICAAGFEGDGSNCTECKPGHWGIGCKNTCSCNTANSFGCNKKTGCLCYSNWTGLDCSEDRDECLDQSICPQHYHCVNSVASFSCKCNTGYIRNGSSRCDACSGNRYGNDCQSACKCTSDNVKDVQQMCDHETGTCICKYGWQGNCSEDRNECTEYPDICTNDPTKKCWNTMGGFECVCFIEKTDGTCLKDNDECKEEMPCENNGTCRNTYGSYVCNCSNGWTDENCSTDVDECGTSPCLNDGTCHNTAGSYRCQCSDGWTGIHCSMDVNECVSSPCENNGTCANIMGSYVCNCSSGWTERNCLKACSNNTYGKDCGKLCMCNARNAVNANQTCKTTDGTCICKSGWKDDCSQDMEECLLTPDGCKTSGNVDLLVGLGTGIPLFVLSLVIIGIALLVYRKKRKVVRFLPEVWFKAKIPKMEMEIPSG